MEKMPSGNADTTFVSNCDHDCIISYMARIFKVLCISLTQSVVFQCISVLHSIMELMLPWISKGFLKMELILLYIAIFINTNHHFE